MNLFWILVIIFVVCLVLFALAWCFYLCQTSQEYHDSRPKFGDRDLELGGFEAQEGTQHNSRREL